MKDVRLDFHPSLSEPSFWEICFQVPLRNGPKSITLFSDRLVARGLAQSPSIGTQNCRWDPKATLMLTPQNSHTLFLMWLCPSPTSSNPPSKESCFDDPTVILENLKAWTVVAAMVRARGFDLSYQSGRAGSKLGASGFLPSSLWDKPLSTMLALVQPQFCSHLCSDPCYTGRSLLLLLIGCSPHSVPRPSHICLWTKYPSLSATQALLGNTLLVEPGTDLPFFHLPTHQLINRYMLTCLCSLRLIPLLV